MITMGKDTELERCSPDCGCVKVEGDHHEELSDTTKRLLKEIELREQTEHFERDVHEQRYTSLKRVMRDAYMQSAHGKGEERHATDESFEDQKIVVMAKWLKGSSAGGPLFQAAKKIFEAATLEKRYTTTGVKRAIHELHGAIVYLCAAVLVLEGEDDGEE